MSRVEVRRSWLLAGAVVVAGATAGGVMAVDGAQSAALQQTQLPPIGDRSATASPSASAPVEAVAAIATTRSAAVPNTATETAVAAAVTTPAAAPSCESPDARYDDYREKFIAAGNPIECLDPMAWEGSLSPDGLDALRDFARRHRHDPVYGRDPVPGANELIRARYGPGADQAFEVLGRRDSTSAGSTSGGGFLERLHQHLTAPQPAVRSAGS